MIKAYFDGRLGADADLRTSQNGGTQFYSMRVATDDFRNGNNETVWVNVIVNSDRVGKMKFTKGSHVLVSGTLRASTYQTRAGETAISLDMMADSISYVRSGGSGTTQAEEAVETTANFGKLKKEEVEPKKAKVSKTPASAPAAASTDVDDLPF